MFIDIGLCVKYLGAPAEHWPQAVEAGKWIETDAAAKAMAEAAVNALKKGDRGNGSFAMKSLKQYAQRMAPEHAEGAIPAVFAAALPNTLENLRAEGMPEELILDTLSDYGTWAKYYLKHTGKVGIGESGWEVNFHSGRIVKLGRVQFETCLFPVPYSIYKNKATGEIIPVLHDGEGVNAEGFLAVDEPAAFKAVMKIENGTLTCNKTDTKRARVLAETVQYAMADLELLIAQGMPVLNMHIPEVGPLTDESVGESLRMAREYFGAKGYPNAVAICESWLLDPALRECVSAPSNILDYQNRFTLFPWDGDHSDTANRVFGRGADFDNVDALPEDTSLRRGVKAYLKSKKPLRDAGGIVIL